MDKKCFLCQEIVAENNFSSNQEDGISFLLLCQILELSHFENNIHKLENIRYCSPCSKRILNIQNLLEELERVEKEVLHQKYLIEVQLKQTCTTNHHNEKENSLEYFRDEIINELRSSSTRTMITKIRKGKVGRRGRKYVRIGKNISIPKTTILPLQKNLDENFDLVHNENFVMHHNNSDVNPIPQESPFSIPVTNIGMTPDCQQRLHKQKLNKELHVNSSDEQERINLPLFDNTKNDDTSSSRFYGFSNVKIEMISQDFSQSCGDIHSSEEPIPKSDLLSQNNIVSVVGITKDTTNIPMSLPELQYNIDKMKTETSEILPMSEGLIIDENFICVLCGASFDLYNQFEEHEQLHKTLDFRTTSSIKQANSLSYENLNKFKSWYEKNKTCNRAKECLECGKILSSTSSWRNHVMTAHRDRRQCKFQCTFCDYGCEKTSNFKRHLARHTENFSTS